MRLKMFREYSVKNLEEMVNLWLEEGNVTIHHIAFQLVESENARVYAMAIFYT